jgi:hypothetical protein
MTFTQIIANVKYCLLVRKVKKNADVLRQFKIR